MFPKTGVFMLAACCFALPALAQYDVPSYKADSTKMADLTFPRQPVELGLFSTIHNGLFKPEGMKEGERYPALVLLHNCAGIMPRHMRYWIESGTRAGYVVLLIDGMRGNKTNCFPPTPISVGRRLKDAFDALAHLAALPFVDPKRIFAAGYSQGGFTASQISSREVAEAFVPVGAPRFAGTVAFYSTCRWPAGTIPRVNVDIPIVRPDIDRPHMLLMGALDNETPAAWCDAVLPAVQAAGAPVSSHVYAGTVHCWDCIESDGLNKTDFKGDRISYRYDPKLTDDSRRRMFEFFDGIR